MIDWSAGSTGVGDVLGVEVGLGLGARSGLLLSDADGLGTVKGSLTVGDGAKLVDIGVVFVFSEACVFHRSDQGAILINA